MWRYKYYDYDEEKYVDYKVRQMDRPFPSWKKKMMKEEKLKKMA
jgi:hypothetical protein